MATNIEIVNAAVTLIIKAAILAARFSGNASKAQLSFLIFVDFDILESFFAFSLLR